MTSQARPEVTPEHRARRLLEQMQGMVPKQNKNDQKLKGDISDSVKIQIIKCSSVCKEIGQSRNNSHIV